MTPARLIQLQGAGLARAERTLLEDLELTLSMHQVMALLGPAGVGKSSLLAALAGAHDEGLTRLGEWPPAPTEGLVYVPQKSPLARTLAALSSDAALLLLDEPTRGLSEAQSQQLAAQLKEHRLRGAALVVTHDLRFAKEIADTICLLSAGKILWSGLAADFFQRPQSPLVQRFLTQGNCWPGPKTPMLPTHFHWVLPNQLAGMGAPGLSQDLEEDLAALSEAGINLLVTLTEEAPQLNQLKSYGIASRHLPIRDMGVPSLHSAANVCREIERLLGEGGRAALHCRAGLGRTGTMLAAFLVWRGATAEQAFAQLAVVNKGFIQTRTQREFVLRFEREFPPRRVSDAEP